MQDNNKSDVLTEISANSKDRFMALAELIDQITMRKAKESGIDFDETPSPAL